MFNPEMMAMAQDMMSKMTPEQMAQMQRQMQNVSPDMMQMAMNQMQNMTPDQIQQMRAATQNMTGDQIAAQASASVGQASAQQQYGLTASEQLKVEGNRLHGAKQYGEAAEKYQRAISNLAGQTSLAARQLRTSCQSNLASCYLQLQRWQECVDQCGEVLAVEASNRKALYRRGQAQCALGRYDAAVDDLRQAVRLSPESEKDLIREKLAEAKQKQRQAQQGEGWAGLDVQGVAAWHGAECGCSREGVFLRCM
jgi:tetratricopeptide (TPR) repeat protein